MADQNITALPVKTAPADSDKVMLVDSAEGYLIDYGKLADAILNKLTSKTYSGLGTTATNLIGAISELNSNMIFYEDIAFDNIAFESGAVGTKAAQFIDENKEGYNIIGVSVRDIYNSAEFIPIVFSAHNKTYLNLYRTTGNAVSYSSVTVRIIYKKIKS